MSSSYIKSDYDERECEYDYYGDTRNNPKHNEEKPYAKNSYNYKIYKKINGSICKKAMQKEEYEENKQKNELEKKESEENEAIYKSERKRKLKYTEKEDENYENNYQKIVTKPKKSKKPRKDRIRF